MENSENNVNENTELILKSKLINGEKYYEDIYFEKLKGKIRLYPLTESEYLEVKIRKLKTINKISDDNEKDVDIIEVLKDEFDANCLLLSYSLSKGKEKYEIKDIKNFSPPGVINDIALEVNRISEVENDTLDPFRIFKTEFEKYFNGVQNTDRDGNTDIPEK